MKLKAILLLFATLLMVVSEVNSRRGMRYNYRNLRDFCRATRRRGSRYGTALELLAYFDLTANNKGFACLKVTACHGTPVCFVTKQNLKNKSINDTTTWQDLMKFIQRDRRIEPIYDHSMDGLNGDKYKALSQYVRPARQAAIYRMCQDATVYRFVSPDNSTNSSQSQSSQASGGSTMTPTTSSGFNPAGGSVNPVNLCMFAQRRKKNRRVRGKRVQQNSTADLLQCTGLNCPCERICVGQGKRKNLSECSTFRIICTFNCGERMTLSRVKKINKSRASKMLKNLRKNKNKNNKKKNKRKRNKKQRNKKHGKAKKTAG